MEKILAVYDADSLYTERLGRFLRHRKELPFQIYSFTEEQELQQFSKKKDIDVLLYSKEVDHRFLSQISAREKILLSEGNAVSSEDIPSIYKYQAGDVIVKELLSHYGDFPMDMPGKRDLKSRIYMVFSPIGRSGKTSFAWELARVLSEDRKILFLSLEEAGSFQQDMPVSAPFGLSEALYYFKEGKLDKMKFLSLCQDFQSVSFLPMMKNPDDLSILNTQELSRFLELLSRISQCDAIVVDTDSMISRFYECFSVCSRVFVPIREDSSSQRKLENFQRFLEHAGVKQGEESFVKLLLPGDSEEEKFRSGLHDYTEAVVQHYIL